LPLIAALAGSAGTCVAADDRAAMTARAASPQGVSLPFPDDPALPWDKFGLFIGIDTYQGLPEHSLPGCVNDAVGFWQIFTTTFGVQRSSLLTNGQATRDGIGQALRALLEQVKIARTHTTNPITVVITYAGHGSRVLRRVDDANGRDEGTWVAADSTNLADAQGAKDVRASELHKVYSSLSSLGAQVIFISDACHSGTSFRGEVHPRAVVRDKVPPGPKQDLFPGLAAAPEGAAPRPLPGFVWYAACGDDAQAFPTSDENNQPCGRLSYALRRLLPEVGNKTTYGELAGRIATLFSATWRDQRPEFHAPPGKELERFFRGGFPPPHATVLHGELPDGSVELSMGRVHGVSPQSRFTFYRDTDDLERSHDALATVDVLAVDELSCRVRLPGGAGIPPTCVAALDCARLDDFRIALDGPAPDPVAAKLRELDATKQLTLLAPGSPAADAVVHYDAAAATLAIYSPTALPSPRAADQPKPLRPAIPYASPADAETLAGNLLYVARVRRLMNLSHSNARVLRTEIRSFAPGPQAVAGAPVPTTRPSEMNGVARLTENDRFALRITNGGPEPLYLTVFYLKQDGTVQMLYPGADDIPRPVGPQAAFDFPPPNNPFTAEIEDPDNRRLGWERAQLKIVATDRYIDFGPLVVPPRTGARNIVNPAQSRGGDDPLFDLLRDALHGGPETRGPKLLQAPEHWATDEVTFDVLAK
jgi:hypothetical protein